MAFLYDLDWVRTKDAPKELLKKGEFEVLSENTLPFDFQKVGVHLKSQRGGGDNQRKKASAWLAKWLEESAPKLDTDVIIADDWNEPPNSKIWSAIQKLEKEGKMLFEAINNPNSISHLMYKNKSEVGSRLDVVTLTSSVERVIKSNPEVVRWKSLDELLNTNPKASEIKAYIKDISENISDHMPVVTRFYM